jgi:hypothetical protein
MTFRVGQKVVCVDSKNSYGMVWIRGDDVPVEGRVYTVSRTGLISGRGRACIDLVELKRANGYSYGEWRFRPIVERQTDISALKALLVPGTKIRETA